MGELPGRLHATFPGPLLRKLRCLDDPMLSYFPPAVAEVLVHRLFNMMTFRRVIYYCDPAEMTRTETRLVCRSCYEKQPDILGMHLEGRQVEQFYINGSDVDQCRRIVCFVCKSDNCVEHLYFHQGCVCERHNGQKEVFRIL